MKTDNEATVPPVAEAPKRGGTAMQSRVEPAAQSEPFLSNVVWYKLILTKEDLDKGEHSLNRVSDLVYAAVGEFFDRNAWGRPSYYEELCGYLVAHACLAVQVRKEQGKPFRDLSVLFDSRMLESLRNGSGIAETDSSPSYWIGESKQVHCQETPLC